MIFVTVGTQDKQFLRLLQAVDKAIEDGFINEEVIVQAGCNDYESKNMKLIKMLSQQGILRRIGSDKTGHWEVVK